MNRLTIIGNVCREPELRSTPSGSQVCTFSVAVNDRFKRKDGQENPATFFRISAWNAMGENCSKFLRKGSKVAVVGSVSCHPYKDANGNPGASLEVTAQDVEFLNSRNEAKEEGQPHQQSVPEYTDVSDQVDDLPF